MNAIGDKLLQAAEKTGNKLIVQSVKKAERAEQQRKDAKQRSKTEGKTFSPATKTAHGVTNKAVKKAVAAGPAQGKVNKKQKPVKANGNGVKKGEEVIYTSDGGKTILPKDDVKKPVNTPTKPKAVQKPKDTLTDRGVNKLAEKASPKKPQSNKPVSKEQPKATPKKTAPKPKAPGAQAEGKPEAHKDYMNQVRNSLKKGVSTL